MQELTTIEKVVMQLLSVGDEGMTRTMVVGVLNGSRSQKVLAFVQSRRLEGCYGLLAGLDRKLIGQALEALLSQGVLTVNSIDGRWSSFEVLSLSPKGYTYYLEAEIESDLRPMLIMRAKIVEELCLLELSDEEFLRAMARTPNASVLETAQLLNQGHLPEEIAELRKLSVNTINNHLARLASFDDALEIRNWVSDDKSQRINEAIEEVGFRRLKPIKEKLHDESISYFEIGLVRGKYIRGLLKGA